jgi:hypothetical protein
VISNMAMLMCLRRLKGKTQATVHGFRSSFRDWCADHGVPRELAEAALAHVTGGVEGAYYRSDVIDLRRDLMQRWADHCLPPAGLGANVVPLVALGDCDGDAPRFGVDEAVIPRALAGRLR